MVGDSRFEASPLKIFRSIQLTRKSFAARSSSAVADPKALLMPARSFRSGLGTFFDEERLDVVQHCLRVEEG